MQDNEVTGWTGWITFASIFLMFEGILQVIYGFAAIFKQNWYITTSSGAYVLDVSSWGWVSLVLGALLIFSGSLLMRGNIFGRSMGMLLVLIGLAVNVALVATAPIWSTIAIVVYLMIGYAILAHGNEMKPLSQP